MTKCPKAPSGISVDRRWVVPDTPLPRPDLTRHKILTLFQESLREIAGYAVTLGWLLALVALGWYLYLKAGGHQPAMPQLSSIEVKSTVLIGALEKFHAGKGLYPKLLRDMDASPNKFGVDFLYRGVGRVSVISDACAETPLSDACWTGYREYELNVVLSGKTYVYSSTGRRWEDQSPSSE